MKRLSLIHLANLAFAGAAVLIMALGWVLYSAAHQSAASTLWINHSLEVIQAIDDLNAEMSRAETAQRSYLLSNGEAFLAERDRALARLNTLSTTIRQSTSDNAAQQLRIAQLGSLLAERIAIMQVNGQRLQLDGIEATRAIVLAGIGQKSEARVYDLTGQLKREELRNLGYQLAQGFYIARPMDAACLLDWTRDHTQANQKAIV